MISLKFEGGDALAAALGKLSPTLSRRVQTEALVAGATLIRDRAAQLAPRRPPAPDLADHLVVAPVRRTSSEIATGVEATAGIGVPFEFFYDSFLEFGTKHAAAHPFYRPALDEQGPAAIQAIAAALWAALKRGGPSRSGGGGRLA